MSTGRSRLDSCHLDSNHPGSRCRRAARLFAAVVRAVVVALSLEYHVKESYLDGGHNEDRRTLPAGLSLSPKGEMCLPFVLPHILRCIPPYSPAVFHPGDHKRSHPPATDPIARTRSVLARSSDEVYSHHQAPGFCYVLCDVHVVVFFVQELWLKASEVRKEHYRHFSIILQQQRKMHNQSRRVLIALIDHLLLVDFVRFDHFLRCLLVFLAAAAAHCLVVFSLQNT